MAYLPPDPCGEIEFSLGYTYVPPDPCGEVVFIPGSNILVVLSDLVAIPAMQAQTAVISGGQQSNLPSGVGPGTIRMIWNNVANKQDQHLTFPHEDATKVDPEKITSWQEMTVVLKEAQVPYSVTEKIDFAKRFAWQEILAKDIATSIRYRPLLPAVDFFVRQPWLIFSFSDIATVIPYWYPGWKDITDSVVWEEAQIVNRTLRSLFGVGEEIDKSHRTYWGPYWWSKICEQLYFPPLPCLEDGVPFNMTVPGDPGHCQHEFFIGPVPNVRCPVVDLYSGIRDKYIKYTTLTTIEYPESEVLGVYYAQNSAVIEVLPESDPPVLLDFYELQMQIDRDSWVWDFAITLPDASYLELLKPDASGQLKTVRITVNGHVWTCLVESWRETQSFGVGTWQVQGRSPSVVLGAPYDLPQSGGNVEMRQGGQIASDILQYSGYDVTWNATDWFNPYLTWLVPEGIFRYLDLTRIEALKSLTGSVGAYIQTPLDPVADPLLRVLPKYPIQPWNWRLQIMPVHNVVAEQCWEIARSYVPKPIVNAVVVSGVNAGVVCNVKRAGTAADKPAPAIIDDLITTTQAGTEVARSVLGNSGQWVMHTIRLFSLFPPGTEPDLLKPGDIISVTQSGVTFYGQVTGVVVNASMQDAILTVTQTIEVEEPIPED